MLTPHPAVDTAYWVSPALTVIVAVIFGLLVGSFLNVVIHRLPKMMQAEWEAELAEMQAHAQPPGHESANGAAATTAAHARATPEREPYNLMVPRSRCPHCGHAITALKNIPLVSWLVLRGRCSECRAPISARYPGVELLSGVLVGVAIWWFGFTLAGIGAAGLSLALVALTFIDYDTQLLPDSITLPLLWAGLMVNLSGAFVPIQEAVIGAMAGYLTLWTIFHAFRLATGKEGMGYGDFKLLAALGAWLGWKTLPAIILLSSVVGAVVGIALIALRRQTREVPIPFGPYLAGAGLLAVYFGPTLSGWFGLR